MAVSEAFVKAGTKVYHCDDGYYYYYHSTKSNRLYLRCANYLKTRCPARMNVAEDAALRTVENARLGTRPHNHGTMREWYDTQRTRFNLVQRSSREATPYRTLFNQETSTLPDNIAGDLPFQCLSQAMYRARKKANLAIPENWLEYGAIVQNNPRFFTKNTEAPRPFYRTTLTDENGDVATIFVYPKIEEQVSLDTNILQVDATFKVVPQRPACHQLMTMSVVLYNHAFPVVSALITRKSQALYELVFRYVREHLPLLQPQKIVCDFESAIQNTLRISWPASTVVGCWFHSSNCMKKNAKRLGLTNLLQENEEARRTYKMCQVLALLPSDRIAAGFDTIRQYANQNQLLQNAMLAQFLAYVERVWVTGVGAESLSVYKQNIRTNNSMESFHRKLKDAMGRPHPNVWTFTERELAQNFLALDRGQNAYRAPPFVCILTDQRIKSLTARLDNGLYTLREFLKAASHILDDILNPDHMAEIIDEEDVEVQGLVQAWLPPDEDQPFIGPLNEGQLRGRGGLGLRRGRRVNRGRGGGARGGGRGGARGGRRGRGRGRFNLPHPDADFINEQVEADVAEAHDPEPNGAQVVEEVAEDTVPAAELRCNVCLSATRDLMATAPCGHLVCIMCQPHLQHNNDGILRCATCRTPTEHFLRIYFT